MLSTRLGQIGQTEPHRVISNLLPSDLLNVSFDGWQIGLLDGHALRVAAYSFATAKNLGLNAEDCESLRAAAAFHDIGKLLVPSDILTKPGLLTLDERTRVEAHTQYGYELLKNSRDERLREAAVVALHHHEKMDGTGYPHGLKGHDIPLSARIVSVVDVFDALTTDRSYRDARTEHETLELLWQGAGSHFDESILQAFTSTLHSHHELGESLRWFTKDI